MNEQTQTPAFALPAFEDAAAIARNIKTQMTDIAGRRISVQLEVQVSRDEISWLNYLMTEYGFPDYDYDTNEYGWVYNIYTDREVAAWFDAALKSFETAKWTTR